MGVTEFSQKTNKTRGNLGEMQNSPWQQFFEASASQSHSFEKNTKGIVCTKIQDSSGILFGQTDMRANIRRH